VGAELMECTQEEYRADPSLNQSGIKMFLKDPQEYFQRSVANPPILPPRPPTKSQQFGTDVERLAFSGSLPAIIIPRNVLNDAGHRKGAAWTQWELQQRALYGDDVKLLKADEYEKEYAPIQLAVDGLRSHSEAAKLLFGDEVRRHVRIRWVDQITGLPCKCEIDAIHRRGIIPDLKTAADVSEQGFARAVIQFGYYIQAFFYREALHALAGNLDTLGDSEMARFLRPLLERVRDGENLLCCWVAVKNKPSYHAEVHPCDEEWYPIAAPLVRQGMLEIAQARETGRWQTRTHGKLTNLKPPKWATNVLEQLGTGEE